DDDMERPAARAEHRAACLDPREGLEAGRVRGDRPERGPGLRQPLELGLVTDDLRPDGPHRRERTRVGAGRNPGRGATTAVNPAWLEARDLARYLALFPRALGPRQLGTMLVVQKFGGTSVADVERIRNVAARIGRTRRSGHDVVVVVSAMAGETNRLLGL